MFIFTEAGYQLLRAKGRSILLLCASALLCGCMTFYIGNITSAQGALDMLSQTDPVSVQVVNYNGTRTREMLIRADQFDKVVQLPVHDVYATSLARLEGGGRLDVLGLTCMEAAGFSGEGFSFAGGYDGSLFMGDESVCVLTADCARRLGVGLGDRVNLPLAQMIYNTAGDLVEVELGIDASLRVAGIVSVQAGKNHRAEVYMPIRRLRELVESSRAKTSFYYNDMEFKLDDSMDLSRIKDRLAEIGFYHPVDPSGSAQGGSLLSKVQGSTLIFSDEHFIKTAERLGEKRKQFMDFIVPFFVLIILLVTLAILLVLRGARRDMALAVSLGRPKLLVGLANLMAALAAELLGCLIAMPAAGRLSGVELGAAAAVCGAFMLCAVLGDIAGLLWLLRFDTLRLLTQTE